MKLKSEHLKILQSLKGKVLMRVKASTDPLFVDVVELYVLKGWITEEVPPKKGLFGHDGYTELKEIHVRNAADFGTMWFGIYSSSLDRVIDRMQRSRLFFLSIKGDLEKMGFKITKEECNFY